MIRTHARRRGGFTLVELLVVIALLAILAALAAGTVYRVQAGQRVSTTEATLSKLETGKTRLWSAVLDEARDDVKAGRVPAAVTALAGGDQERVRVIWSYLKLKQYFPTSVAEAKNDIYLDPGTGTPVWVLPHLKVFDKLPAGPFPADSGPAQSAACFYQLTNVSVRGERFPTEGLEQQTAEVELGTGGPKAPAFVDAWGMPIAFVRLGYSMETDQAPYVKPNPRSTAIGNINAADAHDPLGKLPTNAPATSNPGWNTSKLLLFWQAVATGTPAAANSHWQYPGLPTSYPFQTNNDPRNPTPTLVSAGPNKEFGVDLLGGSDDPAKDNILSFRLRREGNRGD